jgi:predicted PurR-regulated permease PerM
MQTLNIDISWKVLLKVLLFVFILWFITKIWVALLLFYISFIVSSVFHPIVDYSRHIRIPRAIAILGIYVVIMALLAGLFALIIPPVFNQIRDLINNFPAIVESFGNRYPWVGDIIKRYDVMTVLSSGSSSLLNSSAGLISNAWSFTSGLFGGLVGVFFIAVFSFYLLLEEIRVETGFVSLVPDKYQQRMREFYYAIRSQLGYWARGQLVLCFIIGVLNYIGLSLLGVKYAGALALIAGIFEIVPSIGPTIAAIIAVIVVLPISLVTGIAVLVWASFVQLLENNILVPVIMKQAVGLDPLLVVFGIYAGGKLIGVGGSILAVPTLAIGTIALQHYWKFERDRKIEQTEGPADQKNEEKSDGLVKDILHKLKIHIR